jgi:Dolichyl-phosphate-mannose-protein mannosyltransferase
LWNDVAIPRTREAGLIVALLLVGAALRAWEYFGGASLWLNELAVARNVLDRSGLDLVSRPLDYDQSAPPAYLLATKLATILLGDGELAFRLPPFLAGLAALALFPLVARRVLEPRAALVATALAAIAVPLVQYGAEAKQYSVDVLGTIIVILVAARWRQHPTAANAGIAALAGLTVVWFSNAAVMVLAGAGAGLAAGFLLERRFGPWRQLAAIALAWGAAAGAATMFARHMMSEGAHGWFLRFWRSGFPPDALVAWPGWLARHLERLFGSELGYPAPWLVVVLAVVGVVALARRPPSAFLLVTPIIVTLAAAALHQYPFGGRLTLFLLPLFLLVVAAGVDAALRPLPPALAAAGLVLVVAVAAGAAWRQHPVLRRQDVRPAFEYLRSEWRAGDRLYVYWGAWQATNYYAARYGFHDADMVFGNCHVRRPRQLLAELDQLRGRQRVWVLATHSLQAYAEEEIIAGYYDAIGVRHDTLLVAPSPVPPRAPSDWVRMRTVTLRLYDLSVPARLTSTTAESFVLPPIGDDPRIVDCSHSAALPRHAATPPP